MLLYMEFVIVVVTILSRCSDIMALVCLRHEDCTREGVSNKNIRK